MVRRQNRPPWSRTDPNAPLTQEYRPRNELFAIHYPADFAARRYDEGSVGISRRISLTDDEAFVVSSIARPISDDVREIARVMEDAFRRDIETKGGRVMGGDLRPAQCPTKDALHDGIEIVDMYRLKGQAITVWSCTFLAHSHGFKLTYLVPRERIVEERPLFERIARATELTP